MWKKDMKPIEAAQVIGRYLENQSLYPQEWNDFVETPQTNKTVEFYRQRCYQLDPMVSSPEGADPKAVLELKSIINELLAAQG